MSIEFPENLIQNTKSFTGILQDLSMLQISWIREIKLIDQNRFRFYIGNVSPNVLTKKIKQIRKKLERAINIPINIYWGNMYVDLIPI